MYLTSSISGGQVRGAFARDQRDRCLELVPGLNTGSSTTPSPDSRTRWGSRGFMNRLREVALASAPGRPGHDDDCGGPDVYCDAPADRGW
jgi:hypothetical protein